MDALRVNYKGPKKRFEILEHTADICVVAFGDSLEEAFENSALATTSVMTDVDKIDAKLVEAVSVEGHDLKALLYNWIEELLVRLDSEGMLFSHFDIERIEEKGRNIRLRAKIKGEKFDANKHPQKTAIKAVTYHQMEIVCDRGVSLKFILDV